MWPKFAKLYKHYKYERSYQNFDFMKILFYEIIYHNFNFIRILEIFLTGKSLNI